MFSSPPTPRLGSSRRAIFAALVATLTATGAGAATMHRFAITQTTGSGGAETVLQNTATGSAFQGEVGGSAANTKVKYSFGVAGISDTASPAPFSIGVIGVSTNGYGIAAQATNTSASIFAFPGGNGDGLDTYSASGSSAAVSALYAEAKGAGSAGTFVADNAGPAVTVSGGAAVGIYATSQTGSNPAISGYQTSSTYGNGVFGSSDNGDGVHGDVDAGGGHSGVVGTSEGIGNGVYGAAVDGEGTIGVSTMTASPMPSQYPATYSGVYGQSATGPGVYGIDQHNSGTPVGYGSHTGGRADYFAGVYGFGNDGPGLFTNSTNDFGAIITNSGNEPTLAINGDSASGEALIVASAGSFETDADVFTLDTTGDLYAAGNITYGGTLKQLAAPRSANVSEVTYAAQQTEATVEDVGSAELVNGSASVPLATDFRETIDTTRSYLVFLTPAGDTKGLYVASRGAAGFVVRETQGGRSSLAFDYRIVAHPYGKRLARLPRIDRNVLVAKNRSMDTYHRAIFDGALPDTMAASRANGVMLRAQIAMHDKALRASVAHHLAMLDAAQPGSFRLKP